MPEPKIGDVRTWGDSLEIVLRVEGPVAIVLHPEDSLTRTWVMTSALASHELVTNWKALFLDRAERHRLDAQGAIRHRGTDAALREMELSSRWWSMVQLVSALQSVPPT